MAGENRPLTFEVRCAEERWFSANAKMLCKVAVWTVDGRLPLDRWRPNSTATSSS